MFPGRLVAAETNLTACADVGTLGVIIVDLDYDLSKRSSTSRRSERK